MSLVRTMVISANAFSQLVGREKARRFDYCPFPVNPFGFNGVEPGALLGQKERQDTNAFPLACNLLVMRSDPGTHDFTAMPGSIVPDQEPGRFAMCLQLLAAPVQELRGDMADGTARDKAQSHLIANWLISRASLPQHPIAGECFGIRIVLLPRLFFQMNGILGALPSLRFGQGKSAPPNFIEKANCPAALLARPGDQSVTSVFFSW